MNEAVQRTITASVLLIGGACVWLFMRPWVLSVLLGVILIYILVVEWPRLNPWRGQPLKAAAFSLLYPILPFVLLIILNQCMEPTSLGRQLLLFVCFITFAHDTGAYIAGRLYGRHKIVPKISPQKSWEGFIGGYAASLVVALIFVYYTHIKIGLLVLPFFVLLLNAAGLAGDLFESYLKRRAGMKDSGSLLPGHGGLLDRCDSILFVVTVFFPLLLLL